MPDWFATVPMMTGAFGAAQPAAGPAAATVAPGVDLALFAVAPAWVAPEAPAAWRPLAAEATALPDGVGALDPAMPGPWPPIRWPGHRWHRKPLQRRAGGRVRNGPGATGRGHVLRQAGEAVAGWLMDMAARAMSSVEARFPHTPSSAAATAALRSEVSHLRFRAFVVVFIGSPLEVRCGR